MRTAEPSNPKEYIKSLEEETSVTKILGWIDEEAPLNGTHIAVNCVNFGPHEGLLLFESRNCNLGLEGRSMVYPGSSCHNRCSFLQHLYFGAAQPFMPLYSFSRPSIHSATTN